MCTSPRVKPETDACSCGTSSARDEATSAADGLGASSTRTLLNLSVNTVSGPSDDRAQPCGTDTTTAPSGVVNGTNTCLSGMSPAAFTSGAFGSGADPMSPPAVADGAEAGAVADAVSDAVGAAGTGDAAGDGGGPLPHPAMATATATTVAQIRTAHGHPSRLRPAAAALRLPVMLPTCPLPDEPPMRGT